MDSKLFWYHVENKKQELVAAHLYRKAEYEATKDLASFKGQPTDGHTIFLVSKENLDKNSLAGSICRAQIRLASQRIIEQTHEVASAEQITAHVTDRETAQKLVNKKEFDRKQMVVMHTQEDKKEVDPTSPIFQAAVEAAVRAVLAQMQAPQKSRPVNPPVTSKND